MSAFLDRLKKARLSKGLSQEDVATALGIVRTNYVGLENGYRPVSKKVMKELSKILEVPEEELFALQELSSHKESVRKVYTKEYIIGLPPNERLDLLKEVLADPAEFLKFKAAYEKSGRRIK